MTHGTPLPPQSSLTRWGAWLAAVVYYAENLDPLSSVVNGLDADDPASIGIVQQLVKERSLKDGLSCIRAHFAFLPEAIEKLESKGISIVKRTKISEGTIEGLKTTPGPHGEAIRRKRESVLDRNRDYKDMKAIAQILSGTTGQGTAQGSLCRLFQDRPYSTSRRRADVFSVEAYLKRSSTALQMRGFEKDHGCTV